MIGPSSPRRPTVLVALDRWGAEVVAAFARRHGLDAVDGAPWLRWVAPDDDETPGTDALARRAIDLLLQMQTPSVETPYARALQGFRVALVGEADALPAAVRTWETVRADGDLRTLYELGTFGRAWAIVATSGPDDPRAIPDGHPDMAVLSIARTRPFLRLSDGQLLDLAEALVELLVLDAPRDLEDRLDGFLAEQVGHVGLWCVEDGSRLLQTRIRLEAALRRAEQLRDGTAPPTLQPFVDLVAAWRARALAPPPAYAAALSRLAVRCESGLADLVHRETTTPDGVVDAGWTGRVVAGLDGLGASLVDDGGSAGLETSLGEALDRALAAELDALCGGPGGSRVVVQVATSRLAAIEAQRAMRGATPDVPVDRDGLEETRAAAGRALSALPPRRAPGWVRLVLLVVASVVAAPLWELGSVGAPVAGGAGASFARVFAWFTTPPGVLLAALALTWTCFGLWQVWTARARASVLSRWMGPLGALAGAVDRAARGDGGPAARARARLEADIDDRLARAVRAYTARLRQVRQVATHATDCLDALRGELDDRLRRLPDPERHGWTVARLGDSLVRNSVVRPPAARIAGAPEPLRPRWGDELVLADRAGVERLLLAPDRFASAVGPVATVLPQPWTHAPGRLQVREPDDPERRADAVHRRWSIVGAEIGRHLLAPDPATPTSWGAPMDADRAEVAWILDVVRSLP